MTEKFRPNFLNPEIKVGPLESDKYGGGSFVEVGNLENLPESIREKVPQGYVIKQYRSSDQPMNLARELFLEGSKELKKEISVGGIAKELKHRNLIMKNYFADSLPELIVPTQFVIGRDEKTNKKIIYEIQPRLSEASTASMARDSAFMEPIYRYYHWGVKEDKLVAIECLNKFIVYIKSAFSPEVIDRLKRELPIFIKKITDIRAENKYFPYDCAKLNNLLFTEHGLRLIDTNAVMPIPEGGRQWKSKLYEGSLKILELLKSKV